MTAPAKRGPGRPPGSVSATTRARLIEAARTVFLRDGYTAATMTAIAEVAGVTRPVLNYHWPHGKAEVFAALSVEDRAAAHSAAAAADERAWIADAKRFLP